jgi:putative superfamily III holin-X
MTEYGNESIPALIRSVMGDARELIREEIALAKAELREELAAGRAAGVSFAAAVLFALVGIVLLCIALGGAIAYAFNLPGWVGYGIMSLLLGGTAYFLVSRGRAQVASIGGLPKTRASLQENITWIQSKSSSR